MRYILCDWGGGFLPLFRPWCVWGSCFDFYLGYCVPGVFLVFFRPMPVSIFALCFSSLFGWVDVCFCWGVCLIMLMALCFCSQDVTVGTPVLLHSSAMMVGFCGISGCCFHGCFCGMFSSGVLLTMDCSAVSSFCIPSFFYYISHSFLRKSIGFSCIW